MFDIAKHSFDLPDTFISKFQGKQPDWGPLGYFTYKRTYARTLNESGRTEEYWETVKRIVEGTFSIQKNHCKRNHLPWSEQKAQRTAKRMFQMMWDFKFLPPGRGMWAMGTDYVAERGGACLNNCGFVTTNNVVEQPTKWAEFIMDMSMVGVGVGFDTRGAGKLKIIRPTESDDRVFIVPDTREGWVESLRLLIEAYTVNGYILPKFDFSLVRAAGEPIRGFGGTSSGPEPLKEMLRDINEVLKNRIDQTLSSTDIVDIGNLIGRCVVAGNVRRCLIEDTRIQTIDGFKEIKDINIGDLVSTNNGWSSVTKKFDQGVQNTIKILHQDGSLVCTPNHRVAVLQDINGNFVWKQAKDLLLGDRLFYIRRESVGQDTKLPEFSYIKTKNATTCRDILIPELDEDMAWFLGAFAGDGHVSVTNISKGKNNSNINIASHSDDKKHIDKLKVQLERFGVNVSIHKKIGENCVAVRTTSMQLATYFRSWLKQSKTSIRVPDCIKYAKKSIKLSYICGVLDTDGCVKNRPITICSSVYIDFIKDLQSLLYSCGIESRIKFGKNYLSRIGWQPLHGLVLITDHAKNEIMPYCQNKIITLSSKAQYSNGFPSRWVDNSIRGWCKSNKQISIDAYARLIAETNIVPIEVIKIENGIEAQTYDIEIENDHCFIADGVLVHNSAEIVFGEPTDEQFALLKQDKDKLNHHRWASNNSIFATVGMDYGWHARQTAINGEPGYLWMDNARAYGRMKDPADWADREAVGANPCNEQTLHDYELCTLVETFPARHDSLDEYLETLKMAYLYAKTVTLVPTHWQETNSVMARNRRIGSSQSGIIKAFGRHGRREMLRWCDKGYEFLNGLDIQYSNWLGVPRSIKKTSVKPSGTISLLPGEPPGIHYPHSEYYIRRVRVGVHSSLIKAANEAGLYIEPAIGQEDSTVVISFPVKEKFFVRGKSDVSIWEQVANAVAYQKYWADNQVSITVTFNKHEEQDVQHALELFEDQLKGISFLPISEHGYQQAPYETITEEQYLAMTANLKPIRLGHCDEIAAVPKFCDGESCEI